MSALLKPVIDHLEAANWMDVAEMAAATGVPYHTIAKIKRGETHNPRVGTVEALLEYIQRNGRAEEVKVA